MSKEVKLLNAICLVVALGFLALAGLSAMLSGSFLSTDNLFIMAVCLVMALLFAVNPLLYLKSEGKLPIPFMKREPKESKATVKGAGVGTTPPPPLLDAKGRAMPADVRAMVSQMKQTPPKDV
jgi:hypothetical protein